MSKTVLIAGGIFVMLLAGLVWLIAGSASAEPMLVQDVPMQQFRGASCGCCGTYEQYMRSKDVEIESQNRVDLENFKKAKGVPAALMSCHTTMVGDYFVEGHVPVEAIEKMLQEKPDIAGIAVEGMPSGSPGMPGSKQGPLVVYAVNKDGSYYEYVRL